MHTSPNDYKQYRYLTLANELRVLLVHDAEAPRSAAALSVEIGHFDDPMDRQGMAHFLEHMLFLGTEKYPRVGEFQTFINRNGGSNNAWTGTENTTFFFEISPHNFEEGLDRFGQFFTAPLFNEDAVDKERQAVDSEYKLKIKDDVRRLYQVQKETINQAHPFAKFSVGDLTTLDDRNGQSVRDDLLAFYHQHYSADVMGLVLLGPQSLDQLEQYTQDFFSKIPNATTKKVAIDMPFITENECQKFIQIEPIKELRKLTLSFVMPSVDAYYKIKPLSYIAHLLGNEGSGSLMAILKQRGLINTLTAGGGVSGNNFREFTISLNLTPKGQQQTDEIVQCVFAFIALIKQQGLNNWRYQEKKSVLEMAFRYQEKSRPLDTVSYLVMNLLHYNAEDIIYGDYMMEGYDQDLLEQLLAYFTVSNMRLTLVAQGGYYDRVAAWYDTPYSVTPLTPLQIERWTNVSLDDELLLPEANIYLCEQFEPLPLEAGSELPPQLIQDLPGFRLWHKQEHDFRVPKGIVYVAIDSPHAVSSTANIVKTRLCVELLLEAINESAYPAEIAGMSYNLYAHQGGVTLQLSGFSEKQPQLMQLILARFKNRHFTQQRFDNIKAQMLRNWRNVAEDKPISQLFNQLTGLLQPNNPPYPHLIKALETITIDELPPFVEAMFAEIHIDTFVYGNWVKKDALALAETLKDAFRVTDQLYGESQRPLVHLENSGTLTYELDCHHEDSAILMYYQSRQTTPKKIAIYTLANHLMSTTFFHELRTKQQLGYMVGTGNLPLNRHPGLILYIQSPVAEPSYLSEAIDDFTNAFALVLLELNEAQWQASKKGLIAQISEPDTNLRSRAQRFWVSIGNKDEDFNQRQLVVEQLKKLSRADMIKFIVDTVKPRTANRLVMYYTGKTHHDAEPLTIGKAIESITDFQKNAY
ncbi:insulinase family protein [Photobacterium carnosum]|uniref:Protease 3 n=1 Tax=Photobacterium carnosum TaxID=2023717 RepID=A0A2N4UXP0_9GAMM|nr:insulinase family protein [Photobacterium carnosum]MBY3787222.1 insulinase family protein [Photobacterium carnosum]MCD9493684.1 insulinase family protein [Photobacterium carnosum]MCD9523184.1 insulinase family protein [Photobacterium carnosum]MCD9532571.1 insulinase family protein [Photobacterium carnosum]PLC59791.1 peptidase M16 [Photobacterium carnosum]